MRSTHENRTADEMDYLGKGRITRKGGTKSIRTAHHRRARRVARQRRFED
jgi:hypothetical protein